MSHSTFVPSVPLVRSSSNKSSFTSFVMPTSVPFFSSSLRHLNAARFPSYSTKNRTTPHALNISTSSRMTSAENIDNDDGSVVVMVNGLPGKMAAATAEEVLRRGLILAEEAMTGEGMIDMMTVSDENANENDTNKANVKLQPPSQHNSSLIRMRDKYKNRLIIVDYTHPSVANKNVELYVTHGISFVIGTTGGDTEAMRKCVMDSASSPSSSSNVYAVIAPNMAKQIVAFQTMMDMMATSFRGVFTGYKLSVVESHQKNKADTSGTAKAVVKSLKEMGIQPFTNEDIQKVRDENDSMSILKVPKEHVASGHAFHTYHLSSPDESVHFEFQHNVCGRAVYAAGTVDAVQFVHERKHARDTEQRIFSMIDILRTGSMSDVK